MIQRLNASEFIANRNHDETLKTREIVFYECLDGMPPQIPEICGE